MASGTKDAHPGVTSLAAVAAEEGGHGAGGAIEIVLVLLFGATVLAILARRIGVPYPILLVLGGLFVGLIPGLPEVTLDPDLVFLLFLPPILWAAGYFTSIRELRANARPIALLAVGLVVFTTVVVAVVVHTLVPTLPWAAAFALGAIVAPPDAVAATSVFQRLGVPSRVVTILEQESLLNDATALVAYRFAVVATLTGVFSLGDAALTLVIAALGGALIGLLLSAVVRWVVWRIDDPVFSVVITFLAPTAAYVPAEELGLSGVMAVVVGGIYLGRGAPRRMSSSVRQAAEPAWQILLFIINGAVFILIGLQLPSVLAGLEGRSLGELGLLAVAVSAAAILARFAWIFGTSYLPGRLRGSGAARAPHKPPRELFLISWAGMRGVVSLAAALALPVTLPTGEPFPERNLLIFLTFAVILATLVGQGLSLPLLIRRLGIVADDGGAQEEAQVRSYLASAAVERIGRLENRWSDHRELIDNLRAQYSHRAEHLEIEREQGPTSEAEQELLEHREIRSSVIEAEREALLALRDRGAVSEEIFRRVERDLDLEELRMEA